MTTSQKDIPPKQVRVILTAEQICQSNTTCPRSPERRSNQIFQKGSLSPLVAYDTRTHAHKHTNTQFSVMQSRAGSYALVSLRCWFSLTLQKMLPILIKTTRPTHATSPTYRNTHKKTLKFSCWNQHNSNIPCGKRQGKESGIIAFSFTRDTWELCVYSRSIIKNRKRKIPKMDKSMEQKQRDVYLWHWWGITYMS